MSVRRPWARVLVPLYRVALRVGDALRGEPKRLQWPVVSVGSLSAGGAGKTPVVIALAKMLHERGWGVDVLSRGYGRSGRGVEMVAAPREKQILRYAQDDNSLDGMAERFGDEPVLIAERAGVDVWVGADRFEAGKEAEGLTQSSQSLTQGFAEEKHVPHSTDAQGNDNNKNKGQLHLLDDGFQHRQLGRAMDVVLVTADDLEDTLLPAGNLREPLSALQRADVVVVREDEFEAVGKRVWAMVREGAQMWTVRRTLRFPAPMFVFGAGLKPVAFCAIARPEGFATMLMEAGCGIVETVAFVDHHRYTIADVQRVIEVAKGLNATGFVTTEKDAVKLSAAMRERLEAVGPLMVVALEAEFADAEKVVATVERFARAEEKQIPHSTDAQGNDNKKSKSNGKNEKQILRSAQDDSRKWDDNPKNTGGAR